MIYFYIFTTVISLVELIQKSFWGRPLRLYVMQAKYPNAYITELFQELISCTLCATTMLTVLVSTGYLLATFDFDTYLNLVLLAVPLGLANTIIHGIIDLLINLNSK